jgi:hypothetical protein
MVFGSIGCAFIMSLRWRYAFVMCYVAPLALRDGLRRKEVSARQLTQRLSLVPRCGPRELAGLHNVAPAAL